MQINVHFTIETDDSLEEVKEEIQSSLEEIEFPYFIDNLTVTGEN